MADILDALGPIMILSKVIGLAPFSVDKDSKSLKLSVRAITYTIVLALLLNGNSGYLMYDRMKISSEEATFIQQFTTIALLGCGIMIVMCSMVLIIMQRKKIITMVDNFREVDFEMSKLDIKMPYNRAIRFSRITLVGLLLLFLVLFAHDVVFWVDDDKTISFWITYFSAIVYGTVMEYQFVSGGLWLKLNFGQLNNRLIKFGEENDLSENRKKIDWIGGEEYLNSFGASPVAIWKGDFSKFRIRKISPLNVSSATLTSPLSKIKTIRKIHSNLCEIKELLNSSYSLQLLSSVAQSFVIITSNLYLLFTGVDKTQHANWMSYSIIWTCYRAMELICIVQTCTRTSKAANHTAVVVHKLLAKDWDSDVRNQLKLFSIQLLHRKISFTACGFFTLDMTLLHAIIGAATTYLVILIQFHNTYENP